MPRKVFREATHQEEAFGMPICEIFYTDRPFNRRQDSWHYRICNSQSGRI